MSSAEFAGAAIEIIKLAKEQGWFDKLRTAFRKKHKILVLGSTGAGKTNFVTSLTEFAPKAIDQMNRTEFAKSHAIKISKEPFIIIDTPGQAGHKPRRIRAIREAMKDGIDGVINIVSYGYHEYRKTSKEPIFLNDGTVSPQFLEAHRQKEIDVLGEWNVLLGGRETANWLITLVTKADLWWNSRDEVLEYYQKGAYYDALGDAKDLNQVVLDYSSVFHKFYGVGAMAGTFDEFDRVRARTHLFSQILAAIGKSDGQ